MSALRDYVVAHAERNACRCGQCVDVGENKHLAGHTVDVYYFDVAKQNNPDAVTLKQLCQTHKGEFNDVDLFDGNEHSYIEVGGWIGDQGLALALMGLGTLLGLWQLYQPRMFKMGEELEKLMAGNGFVTISSRGASHES